jgi:VWFA-related protein
MAVPRRAALLVPVTAAAFAMAGAAPRQDRPTFQASANVVAIYVTIVGNGARVTRTFTADDFEVLDDGSPTPIVGISRGLPITATVMLDMSNSGPDNVIDLIEAGSALVTRLQSDDRLRFGTFGAEVWSSPLLTGDKAYLLRVLREQLWPGGPTALWNGVDEGMQSLAEQTSRRVVIVFTDGGEFPSGRNVRRAEDVVARAKREEFMIFGVGVKGWQFDPRLNRLALDTGGDYLEVTSTDRVAQAFTAIADTLHDQYLLGFLPRALDGRTHTIDVHLKVPGYRAFARKAYTAGQGAQSER